MPPRMKLTVYKVQRPLFDSDGDYDTHFFYRKGHKDQHHRTLTAEEKKAIGDDIKMYAEYTARTRHSDPKFIRRIKNQPW